MTPAPASGQCLCGTVSFTARMPPKWVAHCHCTRCQRAHGAAFVTWVGVEADVTTVHDPHAALKWFNHPGGGDRAFCSNCGSSLFFKSPRWPGELHIARALFNEPFAYPPEVHSCYDTHVNWFAVVDDLPKESNAGEALP